MNHRSRSNNGSFHVFYSKSFQAQCTELFQQSIPSVLLRKNPFIQCVGIKTGSKLCFEYFLFIPLKNDFCRLQILQQFLRVFVVAFSYKKFSGGYIEKS